MSVESLAASDIPFMKGNIHACPLRGHSTSFQLVDEFGDGKAYSGLTYEVTDYEDTVYTGRLDATGSAKVENHFCGPVLLKLNDEYRGLNDDYSELVRRKHYPLPITELQVRAEKTRFFDKSGVRTLANPAKDLADPDAYYQVEVSELVKYVAHLPPLASRNAPPNTMLHMLFRQPAKTRSFTPQNKDATDGGMGAVITPADIGIFELGFAPPPPKSKGIALLPNKHHVLEVRPMRALRPMLSTGNEFCALNLYQLSLMSTLSYTDFGQDPNTQPVETDSVTFPLRPSSGNWFGHALPQFDEIWQVDAGQTAKYYPMYEEVPYSKRLELVPFDPQLYPEVNDPELGDAQEHPANVNFLDDRNKVNKTDTQAFICHHDELILVSVRGTSEIGPDAWLDADAYQVPFEQGDGKVHNGFYRAAKVAYRFVVDYMEKFYSGQKLVIAGHSLGGAVALILAEMLRRNKRYQPDIVLYTYGAPRAADSTFIEAAKPLNHHRIVFHNDPVPSVPSTWMNTPSNRVPMYATHGAALALHPVGGLAFFIGGIMNFLGDPYGHHGQLHHFMPVVFGEGHSSSILWEPGCSTINDHGCAEALRQIDGLPERDSFLRQVIDNGHHSMVDSYIPGCWASLRRWQEALEKRRSLVTLTEFQWVSDTLTNVSGQLRALKAKIEKLSRAHANPQRNAQAIRDLEKEVEQINQTKTRLLALHKRTITAADVYGSYADQPEWVQGSLLRWNAHPENIAREQLAMIPSSPEDNEAAIAAITGGYVVGTPFHLDIDSIV
ncbi:MULTISPECIES: lipase family protein [Gammaproteobacteria]|uniref:lipase family protein n=1 Tax=Gammaproteobacteria TaxID=1236 RepID=UPI0019125955|nr:MULTISPECIES: lipase family protein [Gammaproteobacteria]MBK5302627.1 lipase family protein [Bacillus sp. TH86]MBK5322396.1 lipase family protein [Bacillus sp. TH59]MBK5337346.1 lipase family protein [Bacillus sp. TH57]MBK5311404.1 lipase family protein [Pseudomonas sp. TH71]MBK5316893.1 lipase family protein [Erwinia sp. TH79]